MQFAPLSSVAVALLACSDGPSAPVVTPPPSVDVAVPLRGVPNPGANPAVVLLDRADGTQCTGALLAADVVLTARRCLSLLYGDGQCPAQGSQVQGGVDLTTVRILTGDDESSGVERARGRAVLVPQGDVLCGADIALLLLDSTIDDIAPLVVQPTGAAVGDHVRSVTFDGEHKMVRDHVPVAAVASRELALAEAPCDGVAGGPAIDETSGQVVGVLSRSGSACEATDGYDVDTRADAFSDIVAAALAEGTEVHQGGQAKEKKGPVDVGANCTAGSECAAGVCVTYAGSEYCTRSCSATDHCPTDYHCMDSQQGYSSCVIE